MVDVERGSTNVKCGSLEKAHNIFDCLQIRDVQAWNTLFSTLKACGRLCWTRAGWRSIEMVHNYEMWGCVSEYSNFCCYLWIWNTLECVYGTTCKLVDCFLYFGVHRFVSSTIVLHKTNLGKKYFVCCSCYDLFIQLMEGYFVLKKINTYTSKI